MISTQLADGLDKLRNAPTGSERASALKDLKLMEAEGVFDEEELLGLLDEKDFVLLSYAIGAVGRLKVTSAVRQLKGLMKNSQDPLILVPLLETFVNYESDEFVPEVVQLLEALYRRVTKDDQEALFLMDQLGMPALKYFQVSGAKGIESVVTEFLKDDNPTIRWHALMTFEKLELQIKYKTLETIEQGDKSALVREQASLMLEKRNRETK